MVNRCMGAFVIAAAMGCGAFAEDAYIESTGSQAIDTGYFANPKTKVEVDFAYQATTVQQRIFGADVDGVDSTHFTMSSYINGSGWYAWAMCDGGGNWKGFSNNTLDEAKANTQRRTIVMDGPGNRAQLITGGAVTCDEAISTTRTRTSPRSLAIFANNRAASGDAFSLASGQFAKARLYSFKVWDDGQLVRFLLPYVTDDFSGLKDLLTGKLYPSYNGSSFLYGGEIGILDNSGLTVAPSGYALVDGTLIDLSLWRVNGGQIEYKVCFTNPVGTVTVDGETAASIEKWVRRGTTSTFAVSATVNSAHVFTGWQGPVSAISSGCPQDASINVTPQGPTRLTVHAALFDDPYADATVWLRAMGVDKNGNGLLDADESVSALRTPSPWTSAAPYNGPVLTNEWVAMPYRGGKRFLPTLYLAQAVTITNETDNAGKGKINTVCYNGFTSNAGITTNSMTFALRFRPDNTQFRSDYCWIFAWGYNNQASGFDLGLYDAGTTTLNLPQGGGVTNTVTYRKYSPTFFKNGQAKQLFNTSAIVHGNKWHDLIVSVDGANKKLRYVLCRAPWDHDLQPEATPNNCSDNGGTMTYSNEVDMSDGINFTPTEALVLGSEGNFSGECVYTNSGKIAGNYTKSFRGSIQQFVVWNRAMDLEEMKRAIAAPRPSDIVSVGVRDGTSDEFVGGTSMFQEDPQWTLPKTYAPGDSATVTFVADRKGEEEMAEMFRWYAAMDSAPGRVRLALNGRDMGEKQIWPGRTAYWHVRAGGLVAGTNTLTVTRSDAGAGHVKLDAAALGGSWQIGHKDSSYFEFAHESSGTREVYVQNGNWMAIKRVLFGTYRDDPSKGSGATNTIYHFARPQEFSGANYAWQLAWKDHVTASSHLPRWRLNGQDLGYEGSADSKYHTLDIPSDLLLDGDNRLELYNGGRFVSGSYYSLDYLRMEIRPRAGLLVVFR